MQHLACIMDGNRRFAKKYGYKPWIGHKMGFDAVWAAIDTCLKNNIRHLSLYTFSLENFRRSAYEQAYLFGLMIDKAKVHLDELIARGVRVRFVGDRALFPKNIIPTTREVECATAQESRLQLHILFCYGGQQEVVDATKRLCHEVQQEKLSIDSIDSSLFQKMLWLGQAPAPDLIVRTGGAKRLSNFLLFQAAYSELYFTDCFWPEMTASQIQKAIDVFYERKRNFGV